MIRALISIAAMALASACQSGAPVVQPAPPPSVDPALLTEVEVVTSPGGVTAWLVSEPHVPVIAMDIAWRGGSAHEPRGREGAGWVLAYMMNEGAGDLDTREYGARMEDLSMEFGCAVWIDWTMCRMSTLKDTAGESFDMVRLALEKPRLDREPFDRAKRELTVTLKQGEATPKTIASRAMDQALIRGHPYARYATPETVDRISRADIRGLKRTLMTRDTLLVTVVGDITAEELKPKLDEMFGGLPRGEALPSLPDAVARPPRANPLVSLLPQPQTLIMFSGPGVRREDPDFFAAYLINYILGGGEGVSSRLGGDLRDKRGLTYGVATALSVQSHFWRWTGSTSTQNDKAGEALALIRENIARLGRDGPTQQELDDAKAYVTGAFPLAFDSSSKVARNLMGFQQDNLPADYVQRRNSYYEAVTLEDAKRVAAKYLDPDAFTFVMVGQPVLD